MASLALLEQAVSKSKNTRGGSLISNALEKSLLLSTWKVCSHVGASSSVKYSKEFVSTLGQLTLEQIKLFAEDLEAFAKHAKRTVINGEDVKLLVRRIPNLSEHINQICQKASKPKSKVDKKKKKDLVEDEVIEIDEASTSKKVARRKIVSVDTSNKD